MTSNGLQCVQLAQKAMTRTDHFGGKMQQTGQALEGSFGDDFVTEVVR